MRFRFMLAVCVLSFPAGEAWAGYEFQFADSSGTASSSFSITTPATFVDIRVYLVGTGKESTTLQSTGLESYGVKLTWSAGATAQVVSASDIAGNAAFNGGTTAAVTSTSASANGVVNFAPTTAVKAGLDGRILLATFRFTGLTNGDTV